ncbi:MAG: sigma-70 family RNA polymerase sigma factor [Planctomycetota bacterium]
MLLDSSDLAWLASLSRALLRGAHEADDLVQETVLAAIESPPPPEAPRRAWLAAVARRLAARRFRSESRRRKREHRAAYPESLPDSAELVARAEAAEKLTAAVQRLDDPFRRTILLRYLEGLNPEEIAHRDGKPVDTVRWRVRRGLELLRAELDRSDSSTPGSWALLVAPLATSRLDAGHATAGTAKLLPSSVAVGALMSANQWIVVVLTAFFIGGLGLLWNGSGSEPADGSDDPLAANSDPSASYDRSEEPPVRDAPAARGEAVTRDEAAVVDAEAPAPADAEEASGIFGIVVDEENRPIVGATVFLTPVLETEDGLKPSEPLDPLSTDERGQFRLSPPEETIVDLGVVANGFLSQTISDVLVETTADVAGDATGSGAGEPLRIVLERGFPLAGRVVDEDGFPVPGLRVLAHTPGRARIEHVSPSQVSLRADRATLTHARTQYHECRARTDEDGWVEFSGLPDEELVVRALDPGWSIGEQPPVRAGDDTVEWVAKRRLGIRLEVREARTGQLVDRARAVFRMRLTFADGSNEKLEQWVGRGAGVVSLAIDPSTMFPQAMRGRTVTRVVFYGEVESGGVTSKWEAPPREDEGTWSTDRSRG